MKTPSLVPILYIGLFIATAPAQNLDLPYSSGSSGADGAFVVPAASSGISGFGIAYDAERQQIVRYGGQTTAGVQTFQTWVYRSDNWLGWQISGSPVAPPARAFCAMAFDDTRNEVVLFGGLAGTTRMNDTWVWNGSTWTQKSPANTPPERSHTAMAWDATREQVVLFAGRGVSGALQDTWVWDGTDWTQKTPVTVPPARVNHAMAPYPPLSKVAMACGNSVDAINSGTARGDLWMWSGEDWSSIGNLFPLSEAASLVFDPVNSVLLHHAGAVRTGTTTTALSALTSWSHASPVATLPALSVRYQHGAVWHDALKRMIVNGGRTTSADIADTYAWSGGDWLSVTYPNYVFDLNSKPEAIWHFTSVTVQAGATVSFKRNAANNPVLWLASENVTINGIVNVSGASGGSGGGFTPPGGPGGYDGGAASPTISSGQGPGRGRAQGIDGWASVHGESAKHAVSLASSTYGTPFAQPLIGGSGGGGGGPGVTGAGQGGAGGGAIAIASSKDIFINGSILARGGLGLRPPIQGNGQPGAGVGGGGSGGVIRLVADRVIAPSGTVDASGQGSSPSWVAVADNGRVRLEAYVRQTTASLLKGVVSQSVPVLGSILTQAGGRLHFAKVAGNTVLNPPTGNPLNPDVIFTADGDVEIEVQALNVPDGTPVTVTINHSIAGTINLPATGTVTLQQCKAVFTATIPAGQGVMQAFATYNVGGPASP